MNEIAPSQIDPELKREAEAVLREIGLNPHAALALFYAQIIKLRALPFTPSEFPVLQEYGATVEQAETAEAAAFAELAEDEAAGRLYKFEGRFR